MAWPKYVSFLGKLVHFSLMMSASEIEVSGEGKKLGPSYYEFIIVV